MKTLPSFIKSIGISLCLSATFMGFSAPALSNESKKETLSDILLASEEVPCRCYSMLVEGHWVTICIDDNGNIVLPPESSRCEVLS